VSDRVDVILRREFAEPIECSRYGGAPMWVTSCMIRWRSEPDWAGYRFFVRVFGARRKKNGDPFNEQLDRDFSGKETASWLDRAKVSEATIASVLSHMSDDIRNGVKP